MRKLLSDTKGNDESMATIQSNCICNQYCKNTKPDDVITCLDGYLHIDDNYQVVGGGIW